MKNVVITKDLLTTCLLVGLCALITVAQTKPNFTGAWKLDIQKSKFAGSSPGDVSVTIELNHKANTLVGLRKAMISFPGEHGRYPIPIQQPPQHERDCSQNNRH